MGVWRSPFSTTVVCAVMVGMMWGDAARSVELPVGMESLLIQQFLVLLFLASPGKKFLSLRSLALLVQEVGAHHHTLTPFLDCGCPS